MVTEPFLAMTAAEIGSSTSLPSKIAWMSCHFSSSSSGISNLPRSLPAGSVLILDDSFPMSSHDKQRITDELNDALDIHHCTGLLLDFQRPYGQAYAELAQHLCAHLCKPMAVSAAYGKGLSCPVLLPPLPHHIPLSQWITPWQGRDIWLELALDAEVMTLTEHGCCITSLPHSICYPDGHREESLHCHYRIHMESDRAEFTLWRTKEDIFQLLSNESACNITTIGLFQELGMQDATNNTLQ